MTPVSCHLYNQNTETSSKLLNSSNEKISKTYKMDKMSYIQANRDHGNKNLPLYEKQIKLLFPFTFLQRYILFSSILVCDYWGVSINTDSRAQSLTCAPCGTRRVGLDLVQPLVYFLRHRRVFQTQGYFSSFLFAMCDFIKWSLYLFSLAAIQIITKLMA